MCYEAVGMHASLLGFCLESLVLGDDLLGQAMRLVPMHMAHWIEKLNGFLTLNDRDILTHAGRVLHEMAQATAELEY